MLLSDTAIWLYHDRLNISLFDPYTWQAAIENALKLTNADQNSLERVFSIAIFRPAGRVDLPVTMFSIMLG